MHEELIGQRASLSLPCTLDSPAVLVAFIEELMEVSGDEPDDADRLEAELKAAVEPACAGGVFSGVVATLIIHDDRVEIRIAFDDGDREAADEFARVLTAHVA